jgi:hypothetical protein
MTIMDLKILSHASHNTISDRHENSHRKTDSRRKSKSEDVAGIHKILTEPLEYTGWKASYEFCSVGNDKAKMDPSTYIAY